MCQWAERPFVMRGELALRHVTRSDPDAIALVACGLVRHQQAYVVDGFRQRASTRFIETYEQLERELPALQRCDAFVLAIQDGRGRSPLEIVKALTREWPRAAIVIFCPPRAERPMWMPQLTLAGARGFVFEGVNDTSATLAQVVENARNECVAEGVFTRLTTVVPDELQPMVNAVLARPADVSTVETLASDLGVHRKTLVNRCTRARFPGPAELINWCRLALVAELLATTGQTVESIALTLGFPSHTALRNLIKRYTGMRATDLREGDAVGTVIGRLQARMKKGTEPTVRELPIQ